MSRASRARQVDEPRRRARVHAVVRISLRALCVVRRAHPRCSADPRRHPHRRPPRHHPASRCRRCAWRQNHAKSCQWAFRRTFASLLCRAHARLCPSHRGKKVLREQKTHACTEAKRQGRGACDGAKRTQKKNAGHARVEAVQILEAGQHLEYAVAVVVSLGDGAVEEVELFEVDARALRRAGAGRGGGDGMSAAA